VQPAQILLPKTLFNLHSEDKDATKNVDRQHDNLIPAILGGRPLLALAFDEMVVSNQYELQIYKAIKT
jgi:hypothetical protein